MEFKSSEEQANFWRDVWRLGMEKYNAIIPSKEVSLTQNTAMCNTPAAIADDRSGQNIVSQNYNQARSTSRRSSRNRRSSRSSSPPSSLNRISKSRRSSLRSLIAGKQGRVESAALNLMAENGESGLLKAAKDDEDVVMQYSIEECRQTLEEATKEMRTEVKLDEADVEGNEAGLSGQSDTESVFLIQQVDPVPSANVQPVKLALPVPVNNFTALSQLFSNLLGGHELSETDFAWLQRYIEQLEPKDTSCRDITKCLSNIFLIDQETRKLGDTFRIPVGELFELEHAMRELQQNLLSRITELQKQKILFDRRITPNIEISAGRFEDQDEIVNRIITEGFFTRIITMSLNYFQKLIEWKLANSTASSDQWNEGPQSDYVKQVFEYFGGASAGDSIERGNLVQRERSAITELKALIQRLCLECVCKIDYDPSTLAHFLAKIEPRFVIAEQLGIDGQLNWGLTGPWTTPPDAEKEAHALLETICSDIATRYDELCETCPVLISLPATPELEAGRSELQAVLFALQAIFMKVNRQPDEGILLDAYSGFSKNVAHCLRSESYDRLKKMLSLLEYRHRDTNPRLVLHLFWQYIKDRGLAESDLLDFKLLVQLLLRNYRESDEAVQHYEKVLKELDGALGNSRMDCEYARRKVVIDYLAAKCKEMKFEQHAWFKYNGERLLLYTILKRIWDLAKKHSNMLLTPLVYDIDKLVEDLCSRPSSIFPDAEDLLTWIQHLNDLKLSDRIALFISKGDPTNRFYQMHQIAAILTGKLQYDGNPESEIYKHCEGLQTRWEEICTTYSESPGFLKGVELEAGARLIAALSRAFEYFVKEVVRERCEAERRLENLIRLKDRMDRVVGNGNFFVDTRSPDHGCWKLELESGLYSHLARFLVKHDSKHKDRLQDLQLLFAVLLGTSHSDLGDELNARWKRVKASLKRNGDFASKEEWDSCFKTNIILAHLHDQSLNFFVFDILQRTSTKNKISCLASLLPEHSRNEVRQLAQKQEKLVETIFNALGEWIQLPQQPETKLALDLSKLAHALETLEKKRDDWDSKIFEWISSPGLLDHPFMKPLVDYLRGVDPTSFLITNFLPAVFEKLIGRDVIGFLPRYRQEEMKAVNDADQLDALIAMVKSEYELRIKWRKFRGEEGFNSEYFYAQGVFDALENNINTLYQLMQTKRHVLATGVEAKYDLEDPSASKNTDPSTTHNRKHGLVAEEGDDVEYDSAKKKTKPQASNTLAYSTEAQKVPYGAPTIGGNDTDEKPMVHPQLANIRLRILEHARRFGSEDGLCGSSDYLVTCFNRIMFVPIIHFTPHFKQLHAGLEHLFTQLSSVKNTPGVEPSHFNFSLSPLNIYLLYSFQSRKIYTSGASKVEECFTLKRDSALAVIWEFITGGEKRTPIPEIHSTLDGSGPSSKEEEEDNERLYQVMGLLEALLDFLIVSAKTKCDWYSVCRKSFEDHESEKYAVHCSGMKILILFKELLEAKLRERLFGTTVGDLAPPTSFDEECKITDIRAEAPSLDQTTFFPFLPTAYESSVFPENSHSTPFLTPVDQLQDSAHWQPSPLILPSPEFHPQPTRPVTCFPVEANQQGRLQVVPRTGSFTHSLSFQAPLVGDAMDVDDDADVRTAAENLMALNNDNEEDIDFSAFLMDIDDKDTVTCTCEAMLEDDRDVEMVDCLVEDIFNGGGGGRGCEW